MASSSLTPEPSNSNITLDKCLNPNAEPFHMVWTQTISRHSQVQVMFLPDEIYQSQKGQPPVLPSLPTLHYYTAPSSVLPQQQIAFQTQLWQYRYPFTTPLLGNARYLYQPCGSSFSLQSGISTEMVSEGDDLNSAKDASKVRQSMRKKLERFRKRSQEKPNVGHCKPSNKLEWKVKPVLESYNATARNRSEVDSVPAVIPFPNSEEEAVKQGITTVMIKNIPNNFRRMELMAILDSHCRQENLKGGLAADGVCIPSKYDLIYLPMDYRKHHYENKFANLGYAFVNFTTAVAAFRFYKEFNGFRWSVAENSKICQVTRAHYQGKALKERFACKTFMGSSREFMPVAISRPRDGFVQNTYATPIGKFRFGIPQKRLLN